MESPKRIFVVLSTILFLEASAFDFHPNYQSSIGNNFGNNQRSGLQTNSINNGSPSALQSTGTGPTHQTNFQGTNIGPNSYKNGFGYLNSGQGSNNVVGSNIAHGPSQIRGSNNGQRSIQIGGSKSGQESIHIGGSNIGQTGQGSRNVVNTNIGKEFKHISVPNFGQGSNQFGGLNGGQGTTHIGGLNIGQQPKHIGVSNFGQGSNQFSGFNSGQGSNHIGSSHFGQESKHIGVSNFGQGSNQFSGFNSGQGSNHIGSSHIGQESKHIGVSNFGQGSNQFGGLNGAQETTHIGGLNIGQQPKHIVVSNFGQGSNQFSGFNSGQGSNHIGSSHIGQESKHIGVSNFGQESNQFSSLNSGQGSNRIGGLHIGQEYKLIGVSNFDEGSNQFGGSNSGQGSTHIGGLSIGQESQHSGVSNFGSQGSDHNGGSHIGHESTFNAPGLNSVYSSPVQSTSTSGSNSGYGSTLHIGSNNGYGSALNIVSNSGYGSALNISSNGEYGSTLNKDLNSGPTSTLIGSGSNSASEAIVGDGSNVYGSNFNNGLSSVFGSNINTGSLLTSTNTLQHNTALPTNSQVEHNYNTLSSYPVTTGSHPIPSNFGGNTNSAYDKFKIVHVPVNTGSQLTQNLKLPITGNVKYKVLHMNPTESSLPTNVLTTVKQAESDVHKVLDVNNRYKIGTTGTTTEFKNQLAPLVTGINTNQNEYKAPVYYNYDSNKHHPNTVLSTLTKVDQEIKQIISTAPGSQHGNLNNAMNYPEINKLYNYNQPYSTSSSEASSSANSANVVEVPSIYDINFNKDTNPNNVFSTLTKIDSELSEVLEEIKNVNKQQGLQTVSTVPINSTSSTEIVGQYGNYFNNGYQYPIPSQTNNEPHGSHIIPSVSYSNVQSSAIASADSGKNILPNNIFNSLQLADLELNKLLQSAGEKIKYNQQNLQSDAFADSSSTSTSSGGDANSHLSLYNSGDYYPTTSTVPTYNQRYDYSPLALSSDTNTSQSAASTIGNTQNGLNLYGNYYYPNYSNIKPADLTGTSTQILYSPVGQYNAPSTNIRTTQSQYSSGGTYTNVDTLNNSGKEDNSPSKRVTTNTVQTTSTDTAKSTATASSSSERLSPTISTFNYPNYSYNSYPHQNINTETFHKYPPVYVPNHGYQPNFVQSQMTDYQNVLGNVQDSTLTNQNNNLINNDYLLGTQQYPFDDSNNGNSGVSNDVSIATASAILNASQSGNTSPEQTADDQSSYPLNGQNEYQSYDTQSTYSSLDTATNNPKETVNREETTTSFSQTNSESNSSNNNIPEVTPTQSSTNSTNEDITYNGYYHKYSPIYVPNYEDQANDQQPQTTDSPVNEHAVPSYATNFASEANSNSNIADDNMQKQPVVDNTNDKTQDSMENGEDYKTTSKVSNTDLSVVSDTSTTVHDSQSKNINYHNIPLHYQPGSLHHNRYLNGGNHPRYHRLNWHKYGLSPNFVQPQLTNYPIQTNNNPVHHPLTNTGNELERNSDESTQATDSTALSNIDDVTQTQASTDESNDGARYLEELKDQHSVSSSSSQTQGESSSTNVEVLNYNNGYYTNTNDGLKNQPNSYNNDGDYKNHQILINNPYDYGYNQLVSNHYNDANKQQLSIKFDKNAGSSNLIINDDTTQETTIVTTSDANHDDNDEKAQGFDLEHLVQTNNAEFTETINKKEDIEQITHVGSQSSNKIVQKQDSIIQEKDTIIRGQSSVYKTNRTGFAKIGTILNTKPDGTPYSCALDALLKMIDTLERMLVNKGTL